MFRSIAVRLTVLATAAVGVTLVVASIVIVQLVERDARAASENAVEAALEEQAATLNEIGLATAAGQPLTVLGRDGAAILEAGVFERRESGELIFGTLFVDDEPVAELEINTTLGTINELYDPTTGAPIDDPQLRAVVTELALVPVDVDGSGQLVLVGGVRDTELEVSTSAVRRALFITVPAIVLVFSLLAYAFVTRALRPVGRITDEVDEITAARLDERIAVPDSRDEIAHLATTMNAMLGRLERADVRQRAFAADASHELRSPLTTIRTAAELIRSHPAIDTDAELAELSDGIVAEADRVDALLGDLLRLARSELDPGERTPVDLAELVGIVVERHAASGSSAGVSVAASSSGDTGVAVDRAAVESAVDNLVRNALRHADRRVEIAVSGDDRVVAVLVDDDGAGVDETDRETVFERFARLDDHRDRVAGGTGIGLAIVAAVAHAHGGSAEVGTAAELGGARFVIRLPREPDQPEHDTV